MRRMIMLLLTVIATYSQWVIVETPTTNALNSVDCIGYGHAYAVGDDRTILKTTDYGMSWSALTPPDVATGHDFNDVYFEDEMTGFLASDSGKIFFTSDGGVSWIENITPISNQNFYAIDFSPSGAGLAVGTAGWIVQGPDIMWTWFDWRIPTYTGRVIYDVCFPTDSLAYILAHRDIVRITMVSDSVFYEMRIDFSTTYMNAMCTLEPGWVYIVGDSGYIVFSADSLNTLDVLYILPNSNLYDIAFTYSDYAVICGRSGAIFESNNYGLDWDSIPSGTTRNLNSIDFWWDDYGLIVGNYGTILRSSEPVSAPERRNSRPSDFSLSAHPNPFNSAVTITFDCHSRAQTGSHSGKNGNPDNATIEIYDLNGRRVAELPLEGCESAKPLSTNASGACRWQPDPTLPSGVFLVRATAGDVSASKRIVLLK